MFITTEYRRPVESNSFQRRYLGYETLGTWQMINGAMGGPFVNFTYYGESTSRLFVVVFSVCTICKKKLRFVRQFRAMGRTFEADGLFLARPKHLLGRFLTKSYMTTPVATDTFNECLFQIVELLSDAQRIGI